MQWPRGESAHPRVKPRTGTWERPNCEIWAEGILGEEEVIFKGMPSAFPQKNTFRFPV
jgi:hypothetical protein